MDTLFRIANERFDLAIEGGEEFVRAGMREFLPALSGAATTNGGDAPAAAPAPARGGDLAAWYSRKLPAGRSPTMQDAILVFGYYLKREMAQHMFTPTDVKRAFREVNRHVPKSLLQIMGTLKRDHQLLWSPEDRRGQYALTPKGIKHVEQLLGAAPGTDSPPPAPTGENVEREAPPRPAPPDLSAIENAPALREDEAGGRRSPMERFQLLFRNQEGRSE